MSSASVFSARYGDRDLPRLDTPTVDVVVPVLDEAQTLEANVELLVGYLRHEYPFGFRVVIADNASTDATPRIAARLAAAYPEVESLRLDRRGRGLALRAAWLASDADVVSYMDVDLSTNLESFLPLVAPILSGHSRRRAHSASARRTATSTTAAGRSAHGAARARCSGTSSSSPLASARRRCSCGCSHRSQAASEASPSRRSS